jgi:membrane protein
MALKVKEIFGLFKNAASEFFDDDGFKLSASLAFYTVFSIGPLLLVVITVVGFFYDRSLVTIKLLKNLSGFLGAKSGEQVQILLDNISKQDNTTTFGVISILVLIFGATGVFTEIQTSINYIWSIKAKPKRGWLKYLTDRLLSFSIIVGMGFLMLVTLVIDLLLDMLFQRMQGFFGDELVWLLKILNVLLLFAVVIFLFASIYKVLPDAKVSWKDAFIGAAITSLLFLGGKFLISYYISTSVTTETYGAAASIIILLTWVYFSAIILFYGAEFTQAYAMKWGKGITLYKTAVYIVKREEAELPIKKVPPEDEIKRKEM